MRAQSLWQRAQPISIGDSVSVDLPSATNQIDSVAVWAYNRFTNFAAPSVGVQKYSTPFGDVLYRFDMSRKGWLDVYTGLRADLAFLYVLRDSSNRNALSVAPGRVLLEAGRYYLLVEASLQQAVSIGFRMRVFDYPLPDPVPIPSAEPLALGLWRMGTVAGSPNVLPTLVTRHSPAIYSTPPPTGQRFYRIYLPDSGYLQVENRRRSNHLLAVLSDTTNQSTLAWGYLLPNVGANCSPGWIQNKLGPGLYFLMVGGPTLAPEDTFDVRVTATATPIDTVFRVRAGSTPLTAGTRVQGTFRSLTDRIPFFNRMIGADYTTSWQYFPSNGPDKTFSFNVRPGIRPVIRKLDTTRYDTYVLDSSSQSNRVERSFRAINQHWSTFPTILPIDALPLGTHYLHIEQGSNTLDEPYELQLVQYAVPSVAPGSAGPFDLKIRGLGPGLNPGVYQFASNPTGGPVLVLAIGTPMAVELTRPAGTFTDSVFVDWNSDGQFDRAGEFLYGTTNPGPTVTDTLRLPPIPIWDFRRGLPFVARWVIRSASNGHMVGVTDFPLQVEGSRVVANRPQLSDPGSLQVYPNPARGTVTLQVATAEDGLPLTVELYSADGRLVLSQVLPVHSATGRAMLMLPGQPGVYLLRARQGTHIWQQRVGIW